MTLQKAIINGRLEKNENASDVREGVLDDCRLSDWRQIKEKS